jgi:hypothetical protein
VPAGTGTLSNSGTLRMSDSGTANLVAVSLNNAVAGRVEVNAGRLDINKGNSSGGMLEVATGAVLELSGTHTLVGSYSGGGAGAVQITGVMTAGPTGARFDLPGLQQLGSGTLTGNFSNDGTLTLVSGTPRLTDATLTNLGTLIHAGGQLYYTRATLDNRGLYDIRHSGNLTYVPAGTGTLSNGGTLRMSDSGSAN